MQGAFFVEEYRRDAQREEGLTPRNKGIIS